MRGCHISPYFTIQPVIYVIKPLVSPEFFTIERFFNIQLLLFRDSTIQIGRCHVTYIEETIGFLNLLNSGDCFSLWIQEIAFPYMNLQQINIDFRYIYKSSYLIQKVCPDRESNPGPRGYKLLAFLTELSSLFKRLTY